MDNASAPSWANGGPLGIYATAVIVACLGSIRIGAIPGSSAPLMVGIITACAVPIFVAGVIAYRRNETLLGTIFTMFGTTIALGAAMTLHIQVFMAPKPGAFTPEVLGIFWITLCVITAVFAICFGRMSWFLAAGIAAAAVLFLLEGMFALGHDPDVGVLAGWVELGFAAFCVYAGSAILLGEHFQKPVLPVGAPLFK